MLVSGVRSSCDTLAEFGPSSVEFEKLSVYLAFSFVRPLALVRQVVAGQRHVLHVAYALGPDADPPLPS